ncbi:MAG: phage integrase N-terminal SAM-like domain-containing protein, partial [Desulfobacteraceae bacterium]|nr:phage integrase N-terminal SAM-like domain-containing protein [Desulfobacteraceae bacterium]
SAPKLLDQVRDAIRRKHYSIRTEETYCDWIRRYILFHDKKHPRDMGAAEIERFLTHLAVAGKVAASTQNQALCALVFLYKHVLAMEINGKIDAVRAKRPKRLPVVLSKAEVDRLMANLRGVHWLMAGLLYGAGLRLMECVRLRVKDVDFNQHHIVVRAGKGNKDRVTLLPERLIPELKNQIHYATTMIYTHVLQRGPAAVRSPMDGGARTAAGAPIRLVKPDYRERSQRWSQRARTA